MVPGPWQNFDPGTVSIAPLAEMLPLEKNFLTLLSWN